MEVPDHKLPPRTEKAFDKLVGKGTGPGPQTLFHYTGAAGVSGIIRSGEIWATDIRFMNDYREFAHASALAHQVLQERVKSADTKASVLWERCLEALTYGFERSTYVASFSTNRDDLTQWRGYGRHGNAYCVGFDAMSIIKECAVTGCALVPCSYDHAGQRALLSDLASDTMDLFQAKVTAGSSTSDAADDGLASFYLNLLTIAPIIKHEAFRSESEWRIFTTGVTDDDPRLDFRLGRATIIPHLRIPLRSTPVTIREVMVGPNPAPELAKSALEKLKAKSRLPTIMITTSDIPYREV